MSSTGTWISRSSGLRRPASTIVHSRVGPTRKRPTSSSGRWVADSPIRCTGRPASCSSRSSVSARWAPRLVCATAWISSTITHSASREELARARGEHQVERLGRRDQDVRRLAQHRRALLLRRVAGADGDRELAADALERRAQVALDVVGERLQRRDVDEPRLALARGAARRPAGRAPRGTPRASCPTPWAPRAARARRPRSRATPGPAPAWARRRRGRTSLGPAGVKLASGSAEGTEPFSVSRVRTLARRPRPSSPRSACR